MSAYLSFPLPGLASNYRMPGAYAYINFAQGPSTASAGRRIVLFTGPMLSTGTYTANTIYRCKSAGDAEAGAGAGSPLHRMVRAFMLRNNQAECWVLPYAETSGGTPIAATGTLTFGSTATSAGAMEVTVCGEPIVVSYANGETAAAFGAKVVAAINSKTHLPVTAAGTTVATLTAKIKGASQGTASVGVIRFRCAILSGTGLTVAASAAALGLSTGVAGADGTTTEVANMTSALTGALGSRYYYVVFPNSVAASLAAMNSHLTAKALPKAGMLQVAITGYTGTLATGITLATGANYERLAIGWQPNSEHDNAEIAGYLAALRVAGENVSYSYNFDLFGTTRDTIAPLGIMSAAAMSDWPTKDDLNDAINGGLTPLMSTPTGAQLVMSVNTRSKGVGGTVDDFRATETHRVSVCDAVADTMIARIWAKFGGQKIRPDQFLTNGKPNPNQVLPRGVTTPSRMVATMYQVLDEFEAAGDLQEVDTITKPGLQNIKSPTNNGRTEAQFDLRTQDLFHQATMYINEVSPG